MLRTYQEQYNHDMEELINAATLIGTRPTYLTVDEHGYYHLQVSGTIEECIKGVEENLAKLQRIKEQRDKFDRKPV